VIEGISEGSTERFDAVVLDPPAFIKDHRRKRSIAGYKMINEAAMRVLAGAGILGAARARITVAEEFAFAVRGGRDGEGSSLGFSKHLRMALIIRSQSLLGGGISEVFLLAG
jgi:23S rRNA G2069 N7-methylase RlmK/C1962 C5-methylase RlmI